MLKKKEFKFEILSEQHQKEVQQVVRLMAAANKQIYQFPNKPSPALTDLFLISNEASAHQTVNSTLQQVLNTFQGAIQITAGQVTGTAVVRTDTTDDLNQGTNNWYVTEDGGVTDNLGELPTIEAIEDAIIITSWNGSTAKVPVVAGPGIDITGGTISATGTPATVISFGVMYIGNPNTLATDLGGTSDWAKVMAGPDSGSPYALYAAGDLNNFTMVNGALICQVDATQKYEITVNGSAFFGSGVAQLVFFEIFKNSEVSFTNPALMPSLIGVGTSTTAGSPFSCQGVFALKKDDYISIFAKNNNASPQNPIIHYMTVIIKPLSVAGSVGEMQWITTDTSITMAANTGYFTDDSSQVVLTLPASLVKGEVFEVSGINTGGWRIAQQSGQQIITLSGDTTVGAGGYLESDPGSPKSGARLIAINSTTLKLIECTSTDIVVN